MNAWELALVALVLLLGVCGVLLPGVPGPWLVWAAILWWSLTTRTAVAWGVLVGVTALLLVSQVVRWLLPPRRLREAGITRTMALWAGGGAFAGFCVLPVIGAIPGFIGGIYASERLRLGRHGAAKAATRTAMREAGTSILVELFSCLLAAGAWLGAVIWGR
ncbi:hypothetical protein DSC45_12005 [Streptomyces sp. YIM 130001]|uniref:DUF456 domain-containing protein n=1 Tax=Streptomyces sp. YIM 130001 TaxID=2259644 RepID=UPI000E652D80|nr:DUF456 domain-containing protein [Streptomyces sp. YIM 130001]RII17615.1 hypothetical protein DSC45_12005 [Streptomyces sp. YIM 130001]